MANIVIKLDANAAEVAAKLHAFPDAMAQAVAEAMDYQNQITVGAITQKRLTGKGPFPPSQHRLGVVTNVLRRSLRAAKAQVTGNTVTSSIGTNVRYAGVHEFGFAGTVSVKGHQRRAPQGDRFRIRGAVLSRFQAAGTGTRLTPRIQVSSGIARVKPHTRKVKIPARAPIRTGIQERAERYGKAISDAIVTAWGRMQQST